MIPLFAPAQVRRFDEATIAAGTSVATLMERAARQLARAVAAAAGRRYGLRVLLLCGKGNNGGDGLCAARLLREAGADARVHLTQGDELSGLPAQQLAAFVRRGGRTVAEPDFGWADVVVDALLGTGTAGAPREPIAGVIRNLNAASAARPDLRVVACDLPTGVDANTGAVEGVAVRADLTVALGAHKRGLWLWPAKAHCGTLRLADIGILPDTVDPDAAVLEAADVAGLLPDPDAGSHKRTRGVVVAMAGSAGMGGAATLVARGAMAAGAGLVTVATAPAAQPMVAAAVPEALTVALAHDDVDAAFDQLCGRLEGADALAVGPGLGHEPATVALVRRVVAEVDLPVVLDADGLNAFRHDGAALAGHAGSLLVATPHATEYARLQGAEATPDWSHRITEVPAAAAMWKAVVVAKGPGSVIAAPDGRVWVNPTGSAALATGGTGDVLTGLIAAVIAQGRGADGVAAAVWLHGRAGEIAGAKKTLRSVTAGDVSDAVPAVLRELQR